MPHTAAYHPSPCPERDTVEELRDVVLGAKGKPEEGLAFRLGHMEMILKWALGLLGANLATVIGCAWWIVSAIATRTP